MAKIPRTQIELNEQLEIQQHLLAKSCRAYDDGDELEAIRIAGHVRTLTRGKNALLMQLGFDEPCFVSTRIPENAISYFYVTNGANLVLGNHPYAGLLSKTVDGETLTFKPIISHPAFDSNQEFSLVALDEWLKEVVFDNREGISLTRHELVGCVADEDGYAHVDPTLSENYVFFKDRNAIQLNINGKSTGSTNVPISPSLRQVGFEILESIARRK